MDRYDSNSFCVKDSYNKFIDPNCPRDQLIAILKESPEFISAKQDDDELVAIAIDCSFWYFCLIDDPKPEHEDLWLQGVMTDPSENHNIKIFTRLHTIKLSFSTLIKLSNYVKVNKKEHHMRVNYLKFLAVIHSHPNYNKLASAILKEINTISSGDSHE